MISFPVAKTSLAVLLLLSLFLKIPGNMSQEEFTTKDIALRVVEFLKKNGFEAAQTVSDDDMFIASASAADCDILVASLSHQGWHRHVIRQLAPTGSELLFLFDGVTYQDQPTLRTRTHYYWSRLLRYAGGSRPLRPLFGIVSSPQCTLNNIPWNMLSRAFYIDG